MKWFMLFVTVFATTGCFSRMQMGSGSFTFEQGGMFPVSLTEAAVAECIHNQNMRPDGDARRCSMYGGGYGYGGYGGSYYGSYGQPAVYAPRVDPNYYGYPMSYGAMPHGQGGVETEGVVRQIEEMTQVITEITEVVEEIGRSEP